MARKNTKKKMQQPQAVEPDLFGDEFFSQPPAGQTKPGIDLSWEEPEDAPVIAPDKRRAMHATLAIFGVSAVAVGGFLIYTQLLMPTPVTLSASSSTLALPTAVYEPPPVVAAPIAAPVVEPTPAVDAAPVIEPAVVIEPAPVAAAAPVPRAPRAATSAPRSEARTEARAAAPRSEPVDQNSLGAQAMRLLNSGHAADARRVAQQATQANPERADGWIVLGAANASLGDNEAAKTAYANCTARAMGPRVATCRALAR